MKPDLRWAVTAFTALLVMVESGFTPAALVWLAGTLRSGSGKGAAMGIYSVLLSLGAIGGSLLAGELGRMWQMDGLRWELRASVCLRQFRGVPSMRARNHEHA